MGWKVQIGERKEGFLGGTAKEVRGLSRKKAWKGEREIGVSERGLKEISLERVCVGGALAWGNACRTRWFLNRFGWIRTRV